MSKTSKTCDADAVNLRLIAAGNALSAVIEYDLEERGLIVQTHEPYATLTPAGRALIGQGIDGKKRARGGGRASTHEVTEVLLATACEYASNNARRGDVIAAAYRLAAVKLREDGSDLHAADLERAADQAERLSR